jgi:hypothetical protein
MTVQPVRPYPKRDDFEIPGSAEFFSYRFMENSAVGRPKHLPVAMNRELHKSKSAIACSKRSCEASGRLGAEQIRGLRLPGNSR